MMISKDFLKGITVVWIIPIIAAIIGLSMLVNYYASRGTEIILHSSSANGIEAGKTIVKFRDVSVGKVTKVSLDKDYNNVLIKVLINKDAVDLLAEDASFAIISPRIGLKGISGLNTIFSGVYIELSPGVSTIQNNEFNLNPEPKLVDSHAKGLRLKIEDSLEKNVNSGEPITYKGYQVGTVVDSKLNYEKGIMEYSIFIESPYDSLVNSNTKFWISSALDISFGAQGLDVNVASLSNFINGGITFGNSKFHKTGDKVKDNDVFRLYKDEDSANEKQYNSNYLEYILLFDSSVKGLVKGDKVEYLGTQVGEVIESPYDLDFLFKDPNQIQIPVLIRIQKDRFDLNNQYSNNQVEKLMENLIKKGLKGSIESSNIISNVLYINLSFDNSDSLSPNNLSSDIQLYGGIKTIPTVPGNSISVKNKINLFLDKVNSIDFNSISTECVKLLSDLRKTVNQLDKFTSNLSEITNPKNKKSVLIEINKTLEQMQKLMDSYSNNNEFYKQMTKSLGELNTILKDISNLTKQVQDKPNMFIFGNDTLNDEEPKIRNSK